MYVQDQKEIALILYDHGISFTEIVRKFGNPKTSITISFDKTGKSAIINS